MIKDIIKKYKSGKLNSETEGAGSLGFWDLAGEIAQVFSNGDINDNKLDLQESIYQALSILHREMDKK